MTLILYRRDDLPDGSLTFSPVPEATRTINGIDLSHWQLSVNWSQVKAGGIGYAFIKASEGNQYVDPMFAANWAGARSVAMPRGAYHYYRFGVPGQASHFLSVVGKDRGELPMVVDVEDLSAPPNMVELKSFIDMLTSNGSRPMIYTGAWWWNAARLGGPIPWAEEYDLWVAWIPDTPAPAIPTDWHTWRFWQHDNKGRVPGISVPVDLDRFNGI
jgi:lysozyme